MLAPNLDIAGNIFLGNEARRAACSARCAAARMTRAPRRAARARRARTCRRHTPVSTPHGRADADGRDRQGAVARRPHHHHGRADLVADRGRVGAAVRRSSASSRADGIGIIYISHRMEEVLAPRRPHHGAARRAVRRRAGARRGDARQDRGDDGRARAQRPLLPAAAATRRRREPVLEVRRPAGARRAGAASRFDGPPRRDPRLRRARRLRAHGADAGDLRRHARARAARCSSTASPYAPQSPRDAIAAASTSPPRTASATGWCCR